jgi:hypothetical protein
MILFLAFFYGIAYTPNIGISWKFNFMALNCAVSRRVPRRQKTN